MNQISDYELRIEAMDFYKEASVGKLSFYALGVAGEAGEVAEKVKKYYRDGNVDHQAIALELGDVCWYITRLANLLGFSLSQILAMNIKKLESRRARGVQHGSGDNR